MDQFKSASGVWDKKYWYVLRKRPIQVSLWSLKTRNVDMAYEMDPLKSTSGVCKKKNYLS